MAVFAAELMAVQDAMEDVCHHGHWIGNHHCCWPKITAPLSSSIHLVELDAVGWRRFAEETRSAHRADLHQVLAYASLYDADEVTATLVYPLRWDTYRVLRDQGREISTADLAHGGGRCAWSCGACRLGGPLWREHEHHLRLDCEGGSRCKTLRSSTC